MKMFKTIDNRAITFKMVRAILTDEEGEQDAILIHDETDEFGDGDRLVRLENARMPEDAEEASALVDNCYCESYPVYFIDRSNEIYYSDEATLPGEDDEDERGPRA